MSIAVARNAGAAGGVERTLQQAEKTNPPRGPRQTLGRNPARNRRILIEAALDSIAEEGIGNATVSTIIARAGLSRGMIHLHFGGKDNLLVAAAEAFSDRYYTELERQIAGTEHDPAALVEAVVRADLSEAILSERSVLLWHAFRGAARTNSAIARFSDTRDQRLRQLIRDAFRLLLAERYPDQTSSVANEVTLGTLALLEGMWTDFLAHPNAFSRKTAQRIVFRFLNGVAGDCLPRHGQGRS